MGLKLALPALKIRRGPTSRGRKLANREDVRVMACEMCVPSSKNHLPKRQPSPHLPSATGSPSASGKSELQ